MTKNKRKARTKARTRKRDAEKRSVLDINASSPPPPGYLVELSLQPLWWWLTRREASGRSTAYWDEKMLATRRRLAQSTGHPRRDGDLVRRLRLPLLAARFCCFLFPLPPCSHESTTPLRNHVEPSPWFQCRGLPPLATPDPKHPEVVCYAVRPFLLLASPPPSPWRFQRSCHDPLRQSTFVHPNKCPGP